MNESPDVILKVEQLAPVRQGQVPLPVSVVVPHKESREIFFRRYVLPSLYAAGADQVILVTGHAGAAAKRNAGAAAAFCDYMILWDDDCVMGADCLSAMLTRLVSSPPQDNVSYVYCDALEIVHDDAPKHPMGKGVRIRKGKPFDRRALYKNNYIGNMSLMKRADFPGCDESLKRLIDWDMWLSLLEVGKIGAYISEALYQQHYLDAGITSSSVRFSEAYQIVRQKHKKLA